MWSLRTSLLLSARPGVTPAAAALLLHSVPHRASATAAAAACAAHPCRRGLANWTGGRDRPGSNSGGNAASTAGAYQSHSARVAARAPARPLGGGSPLDRQSARDDGAQSSGGSQSASSSRREYRRAGRGGSGGAGGVGKMHFAPRSLGAAAARANPQPQQQPQQQQRSPNAGAGWAPVTGGQQQQHSQHQQQHYDAGGPQSSAQRPHRGAPPHQQQQQQQQSQFQTPPPSSRGSNVPYHRNPHQHEPVQPQAASNSWARSAERRGPGRSHPAASTNYVDPPSAIPATPARASRGSFRFGGERDARGKMAARRGGGGGDDDVDANDFTSPSFRLPAGHQVGSSSFGPGRRDVDPFRTFEDKADEEADMREHIEPAGSEKDFWAHFPRIDDERTAGSTASNAQQRDRAPRGQSKWATNPQQQQQQQQQQPHQQPRQPSTDDWQQPQPPLSSKYTPVFINRPQPVQPQAAAGGAPEFAHQAAPSSSSAASASAAPQDPQAINVRAGRVHDELMGLHMNMAPLSRATVRVGVLLPTAEEDTEVDHQAEARSKKKKKKNKTNEIDDDDAWQSPEALEIERRARESEEQLHAQLQSVAQEVSLQIGSDLVASPLAVDMCVRVSALGVGLHPLEETAKRIEQQQIRQRQEADRAQHNKNRKQQQQQHGSSSGAAKDAAAAELLASEPTFVPVVEIFESKISHAGGNGGGSGGLEVARRRLDRGVSSVTSFGGAPFHVSFYKHFASLVARTKGRDQLRLLSRTPLLRAMQWKAQKSAEVEEASEQVVSSAPPADQALSPSSAAPSAAGASRTAPKLPHNIHLRDVSQLPQLLNGLSIVDATAGFATDAFTLTAFGARVVAYEHYPLFHVLLSQAWRLLRLEDRYMDFLRARLSLHYEDSVQAMQRWADAIEHEEELGTASGSTAQVTDDTSGSFVAPLASRPHVVYCDLFALSGEVGSSHSSAAPKPGSLQQFPGDFRRQIQARYLKLLCDRPAAAEVDAMLHASLRLAQSHVVFKFPRAGSHYRPGDALPEEDEAQTQERQQATAWTVARIFRDKESEFVIYTRAAAESAHAAAATEAHSDDSKLNA